MSETIANILMPPPIMGVTINTVFLNPVVRNIIYAVAALSLAAGLAVFLRRSPSFGTAVRKAVILSFFAAGLVAAAHADFGWSVWVSRDYDELGGLSTTGKLMRIEGPLNDFASRARAVVQDSYELYAPDQYISWRSQYYLLPLRKRDRAQFIVVIDDPAARYDPASRVFTSGDARRPDMTLILNYAPSVYVLKGP